MTNTAVFKASEVQWDVELVPPTLAKVGIIRRRADGYLVVAERSHGRTPTLLANVTAGPYRSLSDAMDAIAAATGGICRCFDG